MEIKTFQKYILNLNKVKNYASNHILKAGKGTLIHKAYILQ